VETQTSKLNVTNRNGDGIESLGRLFKINHALTRLTNLIHVERYWKVLHSNYDKGYCVKSMFSIINEHEESMILRFSKQIAKTTCRGLNVGSHRQELRDCLRGPNMGPMCYTVAGNGAVVVPKRGRAAVASFSSRLYSSKAGQMACRGSVNEQLLDQKPLREALPEMRAIASIHNLVTAYELIKSKPGNMTPGEDQETLDGVDLGFIKKVQKLLKDGKFQFPPARRVQIPKPGKKETRPLTIASPRDKIIQKAIQQVMTPAYEKKFLECSHGFRPGRGRHTAIKQLDAKFQSVKYVIEADFSKAFDRIPHQQLMDILRRNITCQKTLKVIESGLKAGFVERDKFTATPKIGTAQGSVLSPLLCNIYFHELDIFMSMLEEKYKIGSKRPINKEYTKLQNRVKYMRRKGLHITNLQEYRETIKSLLKTPSREHNDTYTRIHYIRYADDFVIGVEGSYKITLQILDEVKEYLHGQLKLTLNETKTRITKFDDKPIEFLGYKIMGPYITGMEKAIELYTEPNTGRTVTRRRKARVRIFTDIDKILKKLETRGIIRKRTAPTTQDELIYRGTFQGNMIHMDHADILRYFNSMIRGIYNYYNFVKDTKRIAYVVWLLEESCCMTLMRKFKLKTMKQAYHQFGPDLGCEITNAKGETRSITLQRPASYERIHINLAISGPNPFAKIEEVWNNKFTKSNLFKACVICETEQNVEMHHVRKIRDLKRPETLGKDFLTRQMMAINRKQIPLCHEHHEKYHLGTLTETEMKDLRRALSRKGRLAITIDEGTGNKSKVPETNLTGEEILAQRDKAFKEYLNSSINVDFWIDPSQVNKGTDEPQ